MELVKSNLKGVIGSSKNGILLCNLENEYKRITNSNLNYKSFDYPDLVSFLRSMNDTLKLSYYGNVCYVHLVTTEDDPQCLKKLCNLIQTTRPSKKSFKKNHNIPSNIILKANEFDNLKISIPNDLCSNDKDLNGISNIIRSNSFAYPIINQRNNSAGFNGNGFQARNNASFNQNDNYCRNKNIIPPYLIPKKSTQQINNVTLVPQSMTTNNYQTSMGKSFSNANESKENFQTNKSFTNGCQQLEQPSDKITLNESSITTNINQSSANIVDKPANKSEMNATDKLINYHVKSNAFTFSVLDWQVNYPDISIDILHKPVKILGIQSGYAFVMISEATRDCYYSQTISFNSAFPGDVFLWQPPINDPNCPRFSIDITKSVPVIYIERISSDAMKVRVIGLQVLLEVQIIDLFEMPKNVSELDILRKEINARQITFVRLALVPKFINIWNVNILSGFYFSPDCLDNNEYIFERCEKRGDFFNIMILIYYFNNRILQATRGEQKIFVDQLISHIRLSLQAVTSEFKNISDNSINKSPESSLFLKIDPQRTFLENKILIGCTRFFSCSDPSLTNNRYRIGNDEIVLERIVYNFNKKTFHYFDNDNIIANVFINNPLWGLYIINEDFVVSRLSYVTKLRFQAAILIHVPSCTKLRNVIPNYR